MHWWMALIGMQFSFGSFLGSPVGVFLSMPSQLATSEVLIGGLIFSMFPQGISMSPCVNFLFWLVVLLVLDSVVHKLNPVQHELLHPWRKSVECWIVLGKVIQCVIFFPLLFLGIYSLWNIYCYISALFNSRLLRVVPIILYRLAYCGLLFSSLVGITVCGCNIILQICGCRLIDGE